MKIKQIDKHNKSEKQSEVRKGNPRVRHQKSIVGKTCEKGKFWVESEKEKELR